MNGNWSLYDQSMDYQTDGLTAEEILIILAALHPTLRKNWMVWKPGNPDWKYYYEFKEFKDLKEPTITNVAPAPLPNFTSEKESIASEPIELEEIHTGKLEKRGARRYLKKIAVDVEMAPNVFKTFTSDISTDGLTVEDNLPEWVGYKSFRVKLIYLKAIIYARVERVAGSKNRLRILKVNNEALLRKWLLN